nr:tyrosine-type recombinase/integrase [Legionella gresilensis]
MLGASSHSGRRTFITKLIEQGVDIKAVSRLAGHASIVTTSIYVDDNPDRLKRIVANLALV